MQLPPYLRELAVAQLVDALRYKLEDRELDSCRAQWPSGLRRGSAANRLLGLRVRIPPGAWMFVFCVINKDKEAKCRTTKTKKEYG